MANKTINELPTALTIDGSADLLPIYTANVVATQSISRNTFLGITGSPVGNSDTQTLTNKTIGNTNTVTLKDTLFTLQDDGDTTKQARFQLSGITTATTRTYTLPNVTDTLVSLTASQTLTNKTLTSPTISSPTITNATISADALTGFADADTGTVYGISVTNGAIQSSSAFADGIILPKALVTGTGSSWAWQSWTPTLTNITLGNGTLDCKYVQIGKTIIMRFKLTLGSTTAIGAADSYYTPPATAASGYGGSLYFSSIGAGMAYDLSANTYYLLSTELFSTTSVAINALNVGSTYPTISAVTTTVPFTWATGDILWSVGTYEVA